MTQDRIEEFDLLKDKLEKHEPSRVRRPIIIVISSHYPNPREPTSQTRLKGLN